MWPALNGEKTRESSNMSDEQTNLENLSNREIKELSEKTHNESTTDHCEGHVVLSIVA